MLTCSLDDYGRSAASGVSFYVGPVGSLLHVGVRCKSPTIQFLLKQSRETEITGSRTTNRSHDLVQRLRLVKKTRPNIPISHPAISITFDPLSGSGTHPAT